MKGSVHNLPLVSIQICGLLTESVPVLPVDLWNDILFLFVVLNVVEESDLTLLRWSLSLGFSQTLGLVLKVHNFLNQLFLFFNHIHQALGITALLGLLCSRLYRLPLHKVDPCLEKSASLHF